MTETLKYRSNAAVTRAVKKLLGRDAQVTTRSLVNGMVFHSVVWMGRGETRQQAVDRLTAAGWTCDQPNEYETFFGATLPLPEN
jgi:hypothetical protein